MCIKSFMWEMSFVVRTIMFGKRNDFCPVLEDL